MIDIFLFVYKVADFVSESDCNLISTFIIINIDCNIIVSEITKKAIKTHILEIPDWNDNIL